MSKVANEVRGEISSLTVHLIAKGLTLASRIAELKVSGSISEVGWAKEGAFVAPALKNTSYLDVYNYFYKQQQYNLVLLDGALIQLLYKFEKEKLIEHRICYLPRPKNVGHGSEQENIATIYEEIPLIRIDYSPSQTIPINHSSTHLHLGYTEHCRIPTSAPVAPSTFILFILRSFYRGYLEEHPELEAQLSKSRCFPASILKEEKEVVYFNVPSS